MRRIATLNDKDLNFKVSENVRYYLDRTNGELITDEPANPENYSSFEALQGDILIGAGFGLRTIVFGLPLRYDIGWPYFRDGFGNDPIHYFSIGIDF